MKSPTMKWNNFIRNGYQIHAAIPDKTCTLYCTLIPEEGLYRVQAEVDFEAEDLCAEKSLGKAKLEAEKWYEEHKGNWLRFW